MFVKYPAPGAVKTRLVPALGAAPAAGLYRALAEDVLAGTSPWPGDYERLVFYDPPEAAEAMRQWLPAGRLRRQSAGDLGTRIAEAFARAFARGARRVVLIGTDTPGLGRGEVLQAFEALERADLVLGPCVDGGYYLVALRAPQPALFADIAWSTPRVFAQTLERASAAGLSVEPLAARRDVDTLEDLRAEWTRVAPLLRRDPDLEATVRQRAGLGAPDHT